MTSLFSKIFGKNPKDNPPNPLEAAERITEVIDLMLKRQVFLEGKIDDCMERAKRFGTKNKRQAIAALKESKRFKKRLEQTDGIITTLEYQREALQNAQSNADVLKVMGFAVKALKNVHKNVDSDKVYDIMDDIAEQHEIAGEIANAISNPIGAAQDIDEEELMRELDLLEQQELEKKMIDVSPLPAPPTQEPKLSNKTLAGEEDALKQLERWAS